MRLTVHWRGRPLLALDMAAQSPDDECDHGPTLQATSGGLFDMTEPIEPDTRTFGHSQRPESVRRIGFHGGP